MTPRDRVVTFVQTDDVLEGMQALRERDGIPFSEQIRRALRVWLESKGIMKKRIARSRKRATRS